MDEAWVGVVAEGQGGEVEEVDDENDLGPDEMAPGEQHYPSEMEQIVQDEVGSAGASCVDLFDIA